MKAIIMAGGLGSRLRPLTCDKPKPLIPVINKPVIEHIIALLKRHNVTQIAITLKYKSNEIIDYLGDGSAYGVSLVYFVEEQALGTAGGVKNAEEFLTEDFYVMSGDAMTDIDLTAMAQYHYQKNALVSLALSPVEEALEYGVAVRDKNGYISRFIEKPCWSEVLSDLANTGIYIMNPKIFSYIPAQQEVDFSQDVFPKLLRNKEKISGYVTENYWCDIGDEIAYRQCNKDGLQGKYQLDYGENLINQGLHVGKNVQIDDSVVFRFPVCIGENTVIKNGAHIGPNCVIGAHSVIGEHSVIQDSVLSKEVVVERECELVDCVVDVGAKIHHRSLLESGAMIGAHTVIEEGCVIKSGVKIWPNHFIKANSTITANVEEYCKKQMPVFDESAIIGVLNRDIFPEWLVTTAHAFSELMQQGRIGIARSEGKQQSAVFSILSGGLQNAGSDVYDFDIQSLCALRHAILDYGLEAGIYIEQQENNLCITFFDHDAIEINRSDFKKLRRKILRQEINYQHCESVGDVLRIYDFRLRYEHFLVSQMKGSIDKCRICLFAKNARYKKMMISLAQKMNAVLDIYHDQKPIDPRTAYDIFFVETPSGLVLCDKNQSVFSNDVYLYLCTKMKLETHLYDRIVVPLEASNAIYQLISDQKAGIIKVAPHLGDYLRAVKLYEGEDAFYQMMDPILAGLLIAQYAKSHRTSMMDILENVPLTYKEERDIPCKNSEKGRVIETLATEDADTTEGVKIYHKQGWILFLPSNRNEMLHMIAEGTNMEAAHELCEDYLTKIKPLLDSQKE